MGGERGSGQVTEMGMEGGMWVGTKAGMRGRRLSEVAGVWRKAVVRPLLW